MIVSMHFWRPLQDVCVNRGPCYPKTEKKSKATVHLITHTVNATSIIIIIIIILYYATRQQSSNIKNDSTHTIIVMSTVTVYK